MQKEQFFNTIDKATIDGCVVGNFEGRFENKSVLIFFCGSLNEPKYYAFSSFDYENVKEEGTDSELYFEDFYEALNKFKIDGKPVIEQIDKMKSCQFIDYID